MPEVRIEAELRNEFGKGAARRTRRAGRVPAVIYGHGAEVRHLSLPEHELMLALKTPNVLIRLEGLPGRAGLALPKAVQRNAIRGDIEHVDLIEVRRGEKVTVEIPVRVTGEVYSGGMLDQQLVQIPVEAEATNIPNGVDVDVTDMEVGAAVHAKDLVLPEGSTLRWTRRRSSCTCSPSGPRSRSRPSSARAQRPAKRPRFRSRSLSAEAPEGE